MTEEIREYRTSQIMLRNQFHGKDKFKIPIIPKGNFGDKDFQNLLLGTYILHLECFQQT